MRGAPQISQERRDGWFKKVHRGHSKPSDLEEVDAGFRDLGPASRLLGLSDVKPISCGLERAGNGDWGIELELATCLLVTLDIAALSMCVNAGFMPHARHDGKGVCAFAVVGSKLDGTGFGKLHIVQIHVAELVCGDPVDGDRNGESDAGKGDALVREIVDVDAAAARD